MAVNIAPPARLQFEDANGNPLSGGKLFTYLSGTTTKQSTFTTSTGGVANANPIVLNASGYTPSGVWLTAGISYKFVLAPSTDSDPPSSAIWSEDVINGINDIAAFPVKASQAEVTTGTDDAKFITPLTLATRITGLAMTMLNAVFTKSNSTATGGGQIYLNGASGNRIDFNTNGAGAPTLSTISLGTKIVLDPTISGVQTDFAIGKETGYLWFSVPTTAAGYKWYGGATVGATLTGAGVLDVVSSISSGGSIKSSSPSAGIGYTTGAGGTVTQATSKSTLVTLDAMCGSIIMNAAALAAAATATFTFSNANLATADVFVLVLKTGVTNALDYSIGYVYGPGTATISVKNVSAGSLSESVTFKFAIIKAVTS